MDAIIPYLPLLSQIASTIVLLGVGLGLLYRYRARVHVPIMVSCIALDLVNVLVIELNRGAIRQTMDTAARGGDWILKIHIVASVITLICYFVALGTGIVLARGRNGVRKAHRRNAAVFLLARVVNYITSFYAGM